MMYRRVLTQNRLPGATRLYAIRSMCALLAILLVAPTAMADEPPATPELAGRFPEGINRFFSTYCFSCHGPEESDTDLKLHNISQDLVMGAHADDWHDVLDALNLAKMPPKDEEQPSKTERDEVIEFLTRAFKEAAEARRSTDGKVVMRRLTNYEYNNTLNALLGMDEDFTKNFPPDSVSEEGFKNNGMYMVMSSMQLRQYIETARFALDLATFEGEQPELITASLNDVKALTFDPNKNKKSPKNGSRDKPDQNNINGRLYWRGFPKSGTVVVDATLAGVRDPKRIDGLVSLRVGKIYDEVNGKRFVALGVESLPRVTVDGERVHLQYAIRDIAAFPHPGEERSDFMELAIDLDAPKGSPLQVVSMTAKGPFYESWPPPSHQRIFIPSGNKDNEDGYAREVISNFTSRAWRRPVTDVEVDQLFETYRERRRSKPFADAIKSSLIKVLASPNFLYLVEIKEGPENLEQLNQYELASRLSYFLWASMPDDKLIEKAQANQLSTPKQLREEIHRLLQDKRSWKFVEQFTSQWLGLDKIDTIAVSPEIYPGFKEDLKHDLKHETYQFFAHVLHENMSALNFIDSDFALLNQRLQAHYQGQRLVTGSKVFEKVMLPEKGSYKTLGDRGGLLTHGSIHMANSDGEDSHVVNRGVWLIDKILGTPPPEPPADIEFDTDIEGFAKMSLKQQLAAHLNKESCANCHLKIDPFGVPFEQYDVIGKFRSAVRKVDQEELKRRLAEAVLDNPKNTFDQIDTDGNGVLSKDEWFTHAMAKQPEQPIDQQKLLKEFELFANLRGDRRGQQTHPKYTISLKEFLSRINEQRSRAVKKINSALPYLHIRVDTSTTLPDATKIGDLDDLKSYLLAHQTDLFAENMVRRLLTYALGRSLEFTDDETVDHLTVQFKANDYKLADLIVAIVQCEQFRTK